MLTIKSTPYRGGRLNITCRINYITLWIFGYFLLKDSL